VRGAGEVPRRREFGGIQLRPQRVCQSFSSRSIGPTTRTACQISTFLLKPTDRTIASCKTWFTPTLIGYAILTSSAFNGNIVYKVDPTGHQTVLSSFTGGAEGENPWAGLLRDSAGNLYGTTSVGGAGGGAVFKLNPAGNLTVLHSFTGGSDGGYPQDGVVPDAAGNLYGTAHNGGKKSGGVVFKIKP
jgi:uncharacterized repeat protein (TIGR03803 family)